MHGLGMKSPLVNLFTIPDSLLFSLQIKPPWEPDIQSETDTKYIPEEFSTETVTLTPPGEDSSLNSIEEEDMPYFKQFSYHGSRSSFGSYLSTSGASNAPTSAL